MVARNVGLIANFSVLTRSIAIVGVRLTDVKAVQGVTVLLRGVASWLRKPHPLSKLASHEPRFRGRLLTGSRVPDACR